MESPRRLLSAFCGAALAVAGVSSSVSAEESPPVHPSTATSDPQQAGATDEPGFRVERADLKSPEWRKAIREAVHHQGGSGHYTLMRVLIEDAAPEDEIQARATKLKALTREYDGGGGEYRSIPSGGFVFWEHINSSRRTAGRDPIQLGAKSHGSTKLWVDVPPAGMLGVLGDVVLARPAAEDLGALAVEFDPAGDVRKTRLTVGQVVVGGPYGETHTVDTGRTFQLPLPPGDYKILLPDFDMRADRWDVTIEPGRTTLLTFGVSVEVAKEGEVTIPYEPQASPAPQASPEHQASTEPQIPPQERSRQAMPDLTGPREDDRAGAPEQSRREGRAQRRTERAQRRAERALRRAVRLLNELEDSNLESRILRDAVGAGPR